MSFGNVMRVKRMRPVYLEYTQEKRNERGVCKKNKNESETKKRDQCEKLKKKRNHNRNVSRGSGDGNEGRK